MKKVHHAQIERNSALLRTGVVGLVLVAFVVTIQVLRDTTQALADVASPGGGFISSEVHFADASASGLSIVPASCPSTPDFYGECNWPPENIPPGSCALSAYQYTIAAGSPGYIWWVTNFSSGYGHYISGGPGQVIGPVASYGTATVYPTVDTTYVMSVTYDACDKNGCSTAYIYCDATINVTQPPCTVPATLSADGKGYVLSPGQTERKILVSGATYCLGNGSSNTYFIPANSSAETQTFINAIGTLPGVTMHQ